MVFRFVFSSWRIHKNVYKIIFFSRVTISAQMKKRTLKIFINSGYQLATGS